MVSFRLITVATLAALLSGEVVLGSQEKFLSYEPLTTVTDYAAIDLDQKVIEEQLALETEDGVVAALRVYTRGAFSSPYAEIQLDAPLSVDAPEGMAIFGYSEDGELVRGSTAAAFRTGESIIQVQYYVGTNCHVGGNPEPNTEGCFGPSGTLEIGELGEWTYTYNPLEHNFNARTLQGFSIEAQSKYYECFSPSCPYSTYDKFFRYYGVHDYANQWVLAAFNRAATNFADGNMDFAAISDLGARVEAIKLGTAYMNAWMYVIGAMERALDDCRRSAVIDENNVQDVFYWDVAVAVYTGSVPKSSGLGGYLLFTLAQKRCENFGTCLQNTAEVGMAKVNSEIFKNFRVGKQDLLLGDCEAAEEKVARITNLMIVPLIQSVLRYAYIQDKQNDSLTAQEENEIPTAQARTGNSNVEATWVRGATYAAAVLPMLHACSSADARLVHDNMRVDNGGVISFLVVKAAFERNYACLGITCEDVGGLVDEAKGGYLRDAEPCGWSSPARESADNQTETESLDNENETGISAAVAAPMMLPVLAITAMFSILV